MLTKDQGRRGLRPYREESNIGRWVCVEVPGDADRRVRVYGTVMDLVAGTNRPKRIRIQRGAPELAGTVVIPAAYTFLWWADEEED